MKYWDLNDGGPVTGNRYEVGGESYTHVFKVGRGVDIKITLAVAVAMIRDVCELGLAISPTLPDLSTFPRTNFI